MQIYLVAQNRKPFKGAKVLAFYLIVLIGLGIGIYFVDQSASQGLAVGSLMAAMMFAHYMDYARRSDTALITFYSVWFGTIAGCALAMFLSGNYVGASVALLIANMTMLFRTLIYKEKEYRAIFLKNFRIKDLAWGVLPSLAIVTTLSLTAANIASKDAENAVLAVLILLLIAFPMLPLLRIGKKHELKNKEVSA